MIIGFEKPLYLLLLNLIPLVILIYFITLKRKRVQALKFANFDAIAKIKGVDLLSKNIFTLVLTIIIIILVVLSLAGLNVQRTLYSSSFSFVLAIDSSKSMEATDFSPTRLEAAKDTAISFVDSTPSGTKIGVISFSGNSLIEQRLTDDKFLIEQTITKIQQSSVGGTDISEAVVTSTNLLEGEQAKSVIILSDGQLNVGSIDEIIKYAGENDVIVHTIAIGTQTGGSTTYGISKLDEDALKAIAYNTNGEFFKAENKEALKEAFSKIMDLKLKNVTFNLSNYALLAALMLFVVEYILVNTRYRVLP
jgi:Ca-activated chloride channel homolog